MPEQAKKVHIKTANGWTDLVDFGDYASKEHIHGNLTNDGKLGTANKVAITDENNNLTVSSISTIELGYLGGVTSNIQTQLDGKAASCKTTTNNVFRFRYLLNLLSGTNFNDIKGSFDTIRGNTVSWNQQVLNPKPTSTTNWTTYGNTTISFENNSIRGVSSRQYDSVVPILGKSIIPGHKYLTSIDLKNNLSEVATLHYFNNSYGFGDTFNVEVSSTYKTYPILITASSNNSQDRIYIGNVTVNTDINYKNFYILDLTQMFGSGNEPTSTDDPKVQWALNYVAKHPEANEGKVLNLLSPEDEGAGIDAVGFNLWDEQWESGDLASSTGQPISSNVYIRSKNFCNASPNTTYYVKTTQNAWLFWYDANQNFISYTVGGLKNSTATSPANAAYFKVTNYNSTYNHDICINLSNTAKNGTYEPHKHAFSRLDLSSIKDSSGNTLFPYGLCGVGTAHDEVSKFRAVKRLTRIDLGTLDWSISQEGVFITDISSLNPLAHKWQDNVKENILCAKYITVAPQTTFAKTTDKVISLHFASSTIQPTIAVYDTSYNDAASFKVAMSGVYLYFELAEPVIVETDWLQKQDYPAFADGSEEILSDTTMIDADITYSNDVSVVFARVTQAISDGNESITLSEIQRAVQVKRYI